jgi:beta-glucuronidase
MLLKIIYAGVFSMACGLLAVDGFSQNDTAQANVTAANVTANVPAQPDAPAGQPAAPAQEAPAGQQAPAQEAPKQPALSELLASARKAKDKKEFEKVYAYAKDATDRFAHAARKEQKSLKDFPPSEQIPTCANLNDLAQIQFIKGEALKDEGKKDEAVKAFELIISDFSYAQAWDPRGWYHKLAKTSQEAIDRLQGRDVEAQKCGQANHTRITLNDPGKEEIVNYDNYGDFEGAGTKDYKYVVKFQEGLSEAVGEGIYPNTTSVRWDPAFQEVKKQKRLEGSHWDFVHSPDLQAAFFKWALAPEPPGMRLYYTGFILEKSGLIKHAIKAYYALVVHFPHAVGWTYWHTPWYVGPAAISRINYLCKKYPQVNMRLIGASINIENGFDNNINNDAYIVNPGKLVKNHIPETLSDKVKKYIKDKMSRSKIKKQLGQGKVHFVQYQNGDWELLVDNKPYTIKGITYAVVKTGQSPDDGSLKSWMEYDYNNNGKNDAAYDAFVDSNRNKRQDADEPSIGDFSLLKKMGVNTIRVYHQPNPINKELLRDLYASYGVRVIMGDFLGKYALGSGAEWDPGTDYDDPQHQKAMLESVRKMVMEFKDEPFLLMWLLGNENVYGVACNADKKPESFFKFVNEAAKLIKSLDPDHPVAIANGDIFYADKFARYATEVDMFGANVYRGDSGFGSYWQSVKSLTDKPAFISEYGCPAYVYCLSPQKAEEAQAEYLKSCWEDIRDNSSMRSGSGNAIGGILFEWLDEWWKGYEPGIHDTKGLWVGPFHDGFMHEEWLGVCGQGDGKQSPFLREVRKSYYVYQKLWGK